MKRKVIGVSTAVAGVAAVTAAFTVPITIGGSKGSEKPGDAGYTQPLPGKALPPAPEAFGGVIKPVATESTPWWPPRVAPAKGADRKSVV